MNNLQKLIKLRGLTLQVVADGIGHGYAMTQKTIKGTTYTRQDGSLGTFANPTIQKAIAEYIGLPSEHVWGPRSGLALRRAIKLEIRTQAKERERLWLQNDRVTENRTAGNV